MEKIAHLFFNFFPAFFPFFPPFFLFFGGLFLCSALLAQVLRIVDQFMRAQDKMWSRSIEAAMQLAAMTFNCLQARSDQRPAITDIKVIKRKKKERKEKI